MPLNVDPSADVNTGFPGIDRVARALIDAIIGIRNWLNARNGPDLYALRLNPDQGKDGPITPVDGMIAFWNGRSIWAPKDSAGVTMTNAGPYYYLNKGWNTFGPPEGRYVPIDPDTGVGYMGNDKAFGATNSGGDIEAAWYPRTAGNDMVFRLGAGEKVFFRDANNLNRAFLDLTGEWGILGLSGKVGAPSYTSVGQRIQLNQGDGRWSIGLSEAAEGNLYSRGNNPMVIDPLYGWILELESNGTGSVIRRVSMDGGVRIWAGSYSATGTTDGAGTSARFGAYPEWGFMEVEPGTRRAVLLEYDFDPGAGGYTYSGTCRLRTVDLDTADVDTVITNASRSSAAVRCGCFDADGYLWLFYIGATSSTGHLIARKYETSGWTYTEYDITTYDLGVGAYVGRAIYDPVNACFYVSCEYGLIKYVGGATSAVLWAGSFSTGAQTDGNGTSARFLHGIPFMQIDGGTLYVITCGFNVGAGTPPYNTYTIRLVDTATADVTTQHYAGAGVGDTRLAGYLHFNDQAYYFAFRNVNHTGSLQACIFLDTLSADPGTVFALSDPICPATTGLKAINFGAAYDGGGPDQVWIVSEGGFQVADDAGNDLLTVLPSLTINDPSDAKIYLASLKALNYHASIAPGAGAYTLVLSGDNELYPALGLTISPSAAANVNAITGGTSGQIFTVKAGNANLTITHGAGVIELAGSMDFAMGSGATITLRKFGTVWSEVGRMAP